MTSSSSSSDESESPLGDPLARPRANLNDESPLPPYFYPPRYLPGTNPSDPPSFLLGPINIKTDWYAPKWDEPLSPDEELYSKALEETEGFGMPSLSMVRFFNPIFAIFVDRDEETLRKLYGYSAEAINHYNNKHGTCYSVVKVEKAMEQAVSGMNYYITFQAKIDDEAAAAATDVATNTIQTFEALFNEPYKNTIVTSENQATSFVASRAINEFQYSKAIAFEEESKYGEES